VLCLLHNVQNLTVQSVQKLMRMLTRRRVSEEVQQQPAMNSTSAFGLSKRSSSRCIHALYVRLMEVTGRLTQQSEAAPSRRESYKYTKRGMFTNHVSLSQSRENQVS
jgi:hypothetical protein